MLPLGLMAQSSGGSKKPTAKKPTTTSTASKPASKPASSATHHTSLRKTQKSSSRTTSHSQHHNNPVQRSTVNEDNYNYSPNTRDDVAREVDVLPTFPGGDQALISYIQTHLQYPPTSYNSRVEGNVVVQLVLSKTGQVSDAEVIRPINDELNREAVRVCKTLPSFTPAQLDDEPVAVWYAVPVTFDIEQYNGIKQGKKSLPTQQLPSAIAQLIDNMVYVEGGVYEMGGTEEQGDDVDADEDHVSLQYLEHKGDIKKPRVNTIMPRIIYVYEGVDTDEKGRPKLINTKYFGGVYDGPDATNRLWTEVLDYLNKAYDLEAVEKIYINGDGAAWIRTGEKIIPKSKFALDKYHMHKYIIAATSHLEDSADEARSEIYRAIHKKKKWMAEGVFDKIINITEKDTKRKAVENAKEYILGNWSGIILSIKSKDTNVRCSAEGHVSHVYADRMSSRPLGWCRTGADKMSRLRIYRYNQGDMLELVRFQKKGLKQVAGAEEVIYSATEMLRMEKRNRKKLGVLADLPVYSIPYAQVKKIAVIKNHIWGL